jgi:putative phage-type endonuclease
MKNYHKQQSGKRQGDWVRCPAQKKCTLINGEHMTEYQYHQHKNAELVEKQLNSTNDVESLLAMSILKEAMERTYTPVSSYGHQKALKTVEEDKAEAARLIESGDEEAMESFIQDRINSEDFTALLEKRDANMQLLEETKADRDLLKKKWEEDPAFLYEDVRQKELAMIDINEEVSLLRRQINEYKDVAAPVVAHLADLEENRLREAGEWREYDKETLNELTKTAEFESGTREWLEQRQKGIGGSDVGAIKRVKGAYNSYEEIMQSKLEPITDEQVAEQALNNEEYAGAAGRGNAWEKRIFLQVVQNHPDDNITFCKSSWKHNENEFQFANFDGLMADKDGNPDGIVEIKTASVAGKWGNPEDGLDGVPDTYRAQTLWYAQAAGFKRGMVAVVIDDREYREYHFAMTPELEQEAAGNLEAVKKFNTELASRKAGTWEGRNRVRGFSQNALNSSLSNKEKQEIFTEVATMRGVDSKVVEQEFAGNFDDENRKDRTYVAAQLRNLYVTAAKQETLPDYVSVDLETAGSQPTSGSIIEYGASVRTNYRNSTLTRNDTEKAKTSKLYGLSKKALLTRSTGNSEVHGITETQIAKKRQFLNPAEGTAVLDQLTSVGIMMAHNKTFEQRWMSTHVPGFADAVKHKKIKILDTLKLSRRLLTDVPNDKLSSFTARYNVPYLGAHRAYNDAEMTGYAYERMLRELRTGRREL